MAIADLQATAAYYDELATALKAKLTEMNREFGMLSFDAQESIEGLVQAAAANGVQAALHAAQAQLATVLAELAPDSDL